MPLTVTPPQSISSSRIVDFTRDGKNVPKPRVDAAIELRLERGVVRMRVVGKRPHPLSPGAQVVAESLPCLPFEESGQPATRVCARRRSDRRRKVAASRSGTRSLLVRRIVEVQRGPFVGSLVGSWRRQEADDVHDHCGVVVSPAGRDVRQRRLRLFRIRSGGREERLPGRFVLPDLRPCG